MMRSKFNIIIVLIVIRFFLPAEVFCAELYSKYDDTTATEVRIPSDETIEEIFSDSDYDYYLPNEVGNSWFDDFIYWLTDLISSPLTEAEGFSDFINIIFYLIAAGAVVGLILYLSKTEIRSILFGGNKARILTQDIEAADIHSIDFDKLTAAAVADKNYRRAVRLLYLRALKTLTDNNCIRWTQAKTNKDYYYEIDNKDIRYSFSSITSSYEHICYGEFETDLDIYSRISAEFLKFDQTAGRHK